MIRVFVAAILLSISILISCTERIDIDTDNNIPKLAITGIITTDTMVHKVQVSRSVQYLGNEKTKYYLDGVVKINGEQLLADSLYNAYVTPANFFGVPGQTYKLDVWVDFDEDGVNEHYTSSATMPQFVDLDTVYLGAMNPSKPLGPPWMLFVGFQDFAGKDYYGIDLYVNNYHLSRSLTNYPVFYFDLKDDGKYINYPGYYLDEKIEFTNNDDEVILKPGDTIHIILNSLSKGYYDFIEAAQQEIDGGSNPLFAGPPANVPSNISNGALGVFGAKTISRSVLYLPDTPHYEER